MQILQTCDRLPGVDYIEQFSDMPNNTLKKEILSIIEKYDDNMTVDQVKLLVQKQLSDCNTVFHGYYPIVASTEATFYKHILKARLNTFRCMFVVCVEHNEKHQSVYTKVISLLKEYKNKGALDFDVIGIKLPHLKYKLNSLGYNEF